MLGQKEEKLKEGRGGECGREWSDQRGEKEKIGRREKRRRKKGASKATQTPVESNSVKFWDSLTYLIF